MTIQDRFQLPEWREVAVALRGQARALRPFLLLIYTPVLIVLMVVVTIRIVTGTAIPALTRDALQVLEAPPYIGIVSTIGGLIWSGTAAVCLFGAALLRRRGVAPEGARFLLAGGLVTLLLLLDDVFMLHDVVLPLHVGIPEPVVYLVNTLVVLGFLAVFRTAIGQTDFLLLALAFIGLGCSVGVDIVDMLVPFGLRGLFLVEDGAKLFGIVSWAGYFVTVSLRHVDRP